VPGLPASVSQVTYMQQGDLKGFQFGITAGPGLQELPLNIESGLDISGLSGVNSAAARTGTRPAAGAHHRSYKCKITFPLGLEHQHMPPSMAPGKCLETRLPGDPNASPATLAQACVNLDAWKNAAAFTIPLPAGRRIGFCSHAGRFAPDPSLFISSLDGSKAMGLVFGQGSLSPDGTQLAYSGADGNLHVMDISTKQSTFPTENTFDLRHCGRRTDSDRFFRA